MKKKLGKMIAAEHKMEKTGKKSSKELYMEKKISKMMGKKYKGKR